jgi:hypothetical protein
MEGLNMMVHPAMVGHLAILPLIFMSAISISLLLLPLLGLGLIFFFIRKWRGEHNLGQHEQTQLEEMVRMLEKMEVRITNLETVLMQRSQSRPGENNTP